ncbi:WG repeat-containing protein [Flavobacterium agricola]|uniref:WG repeat-containing protein n=1 Tax=Flavobacterium agricola TaxID=2870839 RepID=A0ABY6LWN0_9FLAO|nr:WG repeat-containing protein [Flavobacterium agricola]UYW00362.1 WG repeat-containing protein [Flavobacterium agricola]
MQKKISWIIMLLTLQMGYAQFERLEQATNNQELISLFDQEVKMFATIVATFQNTSFPSSKKPTEPFTLNFNKEAYQQLVKNETELNPSFFTFIKEDKVAISLLKDPNIKTFNFKIDADMYPTKVIYFDGETEVVTDSTRFDRFDIFYPTQQKMVDKIEVAYHFNTPQKIDSLVIPLQKNKTITSPIGFVKVISDAPEAVTLQTDINPNVFINIQGADAADKRYAWGFKGQSNDTYQNQEKKLNKVIKSANRISKKAEKKMHLPFHDFKAYFFKQLKKTEKKLAKSNKQSDLNYITLAFGTTPLQNIIAYYPTEYYKANTTKTLNNSNFEFLITNNDNQYSVYDSETNLLLTLPKNYDPVQNYFYKNNRTYYYLDLMQKKLIPQNYSQVNELNNKLSLVWSDNDLLVVNETNTPILKANDYIQDTSFKTTVLFTDKNQYIACEQMEELTELTDIEITQYLNKGYYKAEKNGKIGVLDACGQIVIPFEYDNVIEFNEIANLFPSDLVFGVKQNDKWGYVNAKNEVVIPFEYDEANTSFSYGIAVVGLNNEDGSPTSSGLINLENKRLTPFQNSGYSASTSNGKRTYGLNYKQYDHLGNEVKQ